MAPDRLSGEDGEREAEPPYFWGRDLQPSGSMGLWLLHGDSILIFKL